MVINPSELKGALAKIAEEVFEQCVHGKQSKSLNTDTHLACGQFYGADVRERAQRGLHGTAAAMGILFAAGTTKYVEVANKLLAYVISRNELEEGNRERREYELHDDEFNTVKQSEILAAITSLAFNHDSEAELKRKIKNGQNSESGAWGFFLDDNDTPSEVATCYAVLALNNRVPIDELEKARQYLWTKQQKLAAGSESSDINAIARRSLVLYALAVSAKGASESVFTKKELVAAIRSLWRYCRTIYNSSFEVSVEYYKNDKNHYVRIPWQLYLAHAVVSVDNTLFYSVRFQKYLNPIYNASLKGGFAYSQASPYLSTRTNSIVFSLLNDIVNADVRSSILIKALDLLEEAWSKQFVRLIFVFLLGFIGLLISNKLKSQLEQQSPMWVEVIGAMFISGLAWIYGSGKR